MHLPWQAPHRPWTMADGSLAAIKWTALVLMVFDHVNKYLYAEKLPVIFQLGRIVMPMFGFVLAYNLARPCALAGVCTDACYTTRLNVIRISEFEVSLD